MSSTPETAARPPGMKIELWSVEPHRLVRKVTTNADGRTDQPLLSPNET